MEFAEPVQKPKVLKQVFLVPPVPPQLVKEKDVETSYSSELAIDENTTIIKEADSIQCNSGKIKKEQIISLCVTNSIEHTVNLKGTEKVLSKSLTICISNNSKVIDNCDITKNLLEENIKIFQNDFANIQRYNDQISKKRKNTEDTLNVLRKKIKKLQSFYDNFKHEQNNVEQKINAQKALLNGIIYNCQIEILNKKISSMQDDLKNAKQGFDEKMREEIIKESNYKTTKTNYKAMIEKLTSDNESIDKTINEIKTVLENEQTKLDNLKIQFNEKESKYNKCLEHESKMRDDINNQKEVTTSLEKQEKEFTKSLQTKALDIESVNTTINCLKTELVKLNMEIQSGKENIESILQVFESIKQETNDELNKITTTMNNLETSYLNVKKNHCKVVDDINVLMNNIRESQHRNSLMKMTTEKQVLLVAFEEKQLAIDNESNTLYKLKFEQMQQKLEELKLQQNEKEAELSKDSDSLKKGKDTLLEEINQQNSTVESKKQEFLSELERMKLEHKVLKENMTSKYEAIGNERRENENRIKTEITEKKKRLEAVKNIYDELTPKLQTKKQTVNVNTPVSKAPNITSLKLLEQLIEKDKKQESKPVTDPIIEVVETENEKELSEKDISKGILKSPGSKPSKKRVSFQQGILDNLPKRPKRDTAQDLFDKLLSSHASDRFN